MRCLSLAMEMVARGAKVRFLMAECLPGFEAVLREHGIGLSRITPQTDDATQVVKAAEKTKAGLVVVDGYAFTAGYRTRLKSAGLRLLVVDDYGNIGPYADEYVLNQGATKPDGLYPDDKSPTLLLGPRYALLRPQFRERINAKRRRTGRACRLLVTAGASDPKNITIPILKALNGIPLGPAVVDIVIGPGFRASAKLRAVAHGLRHNIRIHESPRDMASLMAEADLCITAAGSTLWEVAALGLPSVAVIVADNQVLGTHIFTASGCGLSVDARCSVPPARLRNAVVGCG